MKNLLRNITTAATLGLCLSVGHLAGAVLLFDDFPGSSVDTEKWTTAGQWDPSIIVADGTLALGNRGTSHFARARTVDTFDFHASSYTVTVDFASFDEPDWANAGESYSNMEYSFSLGPAATRGDVNSNDTSRTGFGFTLRWRRGSETDGSESDFTIHARSSVGIPGQGLTEVPSTVEFTINATEFNLVLQDAGGTALYSESGLHGLSPLDSYHFMLLHQTGYAHQVDGVSTYHYGVVNSVTIIPEPKTYASILGLFVIGLVVYRRRCR